MSILQSRLAEEKATSKVTKVPGQYLEIFVNQTYFKEYIVFSISYVFST